MFVCTKLQLHLLQWLRFEFYLSKTHPDCKALFQTPNKATTKNINFASARQWYRNEPLGKNNISKMMERIFIKAELSEPYTNHCIRASTVTSLFQRGVDARKICAITKHIDERSLSHYIGETTSAQKKSVQRFYVTRFSHNSLFSKKLQGSQGKMSPARQPVLAQT